MTGEERHLSITGPFKLKAQLMCGAERAMGPGKAMVLEAIVRTGSISAASRDLGMSDRRTWLLVDSMNRCWSERLVETTKGGGGAGGARLTGKGVAVLTAFRSLEARLVSVLAGSEQEVLVSGLLAAPRSDRCQPGDVRLTGG